MATKTLNIYKLHFTSPVHLGDMRDDYGISLKTITSDTLYAALISCLAKMGKLIPEKGDLGCTISSLFPFYQKDKGTNAVLFFPKPLKQTLPTSEAAVEERKKIKKVAWLDANYFSKILSGNQLFGEETIKKLDGEYLTDEEIDKHFVSSQVSARVTVSRTGEEDAKPFYMDRVIFKDYSGLFFIAEGDTTLLESALKLLQSEGIGTDRNVGNGYFEYEPATLELEIPERADYIMALSSFVPESKEQLQNMLDSDEIAYDFQRRGGWITTPPYNTLRKNVIHAFTAASVFKSSCKGLEIKGRVDINLRPDILSDKHPIWRCGRALFIPIKLN
ncbi:MAG: type III-A CRISPR-associated RAMP protein Csm4 [Paludibacteraceae bacterium]|nr:type III-A CRISPR-associated RAMP protein Csm4 [Paludibacteraceae bacterium]